MSDRPTIRPEDDDHYRNGAPFVTVKCETFDDEWRLFTCGTNPPRIRSREAERHDRTARQTRDCIAAAKRNERRNNATGRHAR